jgi:DNA-binding NtrC family response regulator
MTQGSRNLLIVDDEQYVLNSLRRALHRENCRVVTANSGAQAIDLFQHGEYGVVISDHRMPGMSGAELLERVREHNPDTIRIVLSGHSRFHEISDAISGGNINRFMVKPWDDDDLRQTIRAAFAQYENLVRNRHAMKTIVEMSEIAKTPNSTAE